MGDIFFKFFIQHCFTSDSIVPEDAVIKPKTVATLAWETL